MEKNEKILQPKLQEEKTDLNDSKIGKSDSTIDIDDGWDDNDNKINQIEAKNRVRYINYLYFLYYIFSI